MIALIIGIVLIGTVAMGPMMSNVETPKYNLVQSDSNIDIRKYESIIVAEVNIDVKNEDALAEGFRLLADYIFGNNATKKDIAMTAPVLKQLNGDTWNISFVIYTLCSCYFCVSIISFKREVKIVETIT